MSKKIFKLSLSLLVVVFLASACTLPWKKKAASTATPAANESASEETASSTNQIKKFNSYDELKKFESDNANGANSNLQNTNSDASAISFGGANGQVASTSQADIIKNDGTYIYALVKNDLKIIKTDASAAPVLVSTINFKSRPQDILVNGTSLAVFGRDELFSDSDLYKGFLRHNPYTFFKVYDLSDPSNPKLMRDLNFEGLYTDARLNGDYVYLFTKSAATYFDNEPVVPRVIDSGSVLPSVCDNSTKCFAPDVYYFDIPYNSYTFNNVTAINLKDNNEAISGQSYLLDTSQNLYVSQSNIYISYAKPVSEADLSGTIKKEIVFPKLSSDDQDKIAKIEAVGSYILNDTEKRAKVSAVIDSYISSLSDSDQKTLLASVDDGLKQKLSALTSDIEKTLIHKIAINGSSLEYKGVGEVSGQPLSPLSLNENGDYLRIATSRSQIWSRLSDKPDQSFTNIYVLNNDLQVVGSLENLATNEKISEARFIGDRVYLLTLKQSDPLYAIGLSDPSKPAVLGAVKVPAFASYLYPLDNNANKVFAFGRDTETTSDGTIKDNGLKIALFDFTDLNQPKELDSYLVGGAGSDSIALQDHDAFSCSEEKGILSIPAVLKDKNVINFAGSLIFGVSGDKFVLKGKVNHSDNSASGVDNWDGYKYYDNSVKRSFLINDNIYTFSNNVLLQNSLEDLNQAKSVTLTGDANDYKITPASTPAATADTTPVSTVPTDTATASNSTPTTTATSTPVVIPSVSTSSAPTSPTTSTTTAATSSAPITNTTVNTTVNTTTPGMSTTTNP